MDLHTDNDQTWRHVAHVNDANVAKAAAVEPFLSLRVGRKLRTRDDSTLGMHISVSAALMGYFFQSEELSRNCNRLQEWLRDGIFIKLHRGSKYYKLPQKTLSKKLH